MIWLVVFVCQAKNKVEDIKLLNPGIMSKMYKTPLDTVEDDKPWKHGEGAAMSAGESAAPINGFEAAARNVIVKGMEKRAKRAPSRFVTECHLRPRLLCRQDGFAILCINHHVGDRRLNLRDTVLQCVDRIRRCSRSFRTLSLFLLMASHKMKTGCECPHPLCFMSPC